MPTQSQPQILTGDECLTRRAELELSRAELARRAYVDVTTLWRLETGDTVSDMSRRRIAATLDRLEAQVAA